MHRNLINNILNNLKIGFLLLFIIFVLITGAFVYFFNKSYLYTNEYSKQSSLNILQNLMQKKLDSVGNLIVDYNNWTDAIEAFSGDVDEVFVAQNYDGEYLKNIYGVDSVMIYQLDGSLKMTLTDGELDADPNTEFEGDEFKKMFDLALNIDPESPVAIFGNIYYHGKPYFVAATIITPDVLNETIVEYKPYGVAMMLSSIGGQSFEDWASNFNLKNIQVQSLEQIVGPDFLSVNLKDPWGNDIYKIVWLPEYPGGLFLKDLLPTILIVLFVLALVSIGFGFFLNSHVKLTLQVVDDLKEHSSLLDQLAHYDSITGLPNRVLGMNRLEKTLAESAETKTLTAVLFLDLDHFKPVNDKFGHHVGDKLLKSIGHILESCVREGVDTVSRIGGDEFIVILARLKDENDAVMIAKKIINAVSGVIRIDDLDLTVGVSIGVCIDSSGTSSAVSIVKKADHAMYVAKDSGKNTYSIAA